MDADRCRRVVITPALTWLCDLGGPDLSGRAVALLLAIGQQESALVARRQLGGPARGLWQFEELGGCAGVLAHPATAVISRRLLLDHAMPASASRVHEAIGFNDVLAAAFGRLLLYTDPAPLPGNARDAWDCYMRLWRPGRPRVQTWLASWDQATACVPPEGECFT